MITVTQTLPPRDRFGRPMIQGEAWRRASSFAIDDKQGLLKWAAGMAALGVAHNDTIRNSLLTLDPQSPTYKKDLYALGEQAKEHAGASKAASDGTSIHRATEMFDHGQDITHLPQQLRDAVDAYRQLLTDHQLIPLAAEVFVTCPGVQAAGTLDRLALDAHGGIHVVDLKTSGRDAAKYAGLSWATQIAIYAHADPYCHDRGFLTWADVGLREPDTDVGLVAHVPQDGSPARLWEVNLDDGWDAARTAAQVHRQRRIKYLTQATGAGQETQRIA